MVVVWSCLSSSSSPRDHCEIFLPNDILVDILKRLPAEDLLGCKLVSKEWNSLISTPNFHHMHLNCGGTVPTIVVQKKLELIFRDDWVEKSHGMLLRKIKKRIRCNISSKKVKINVEKPVLFSYHGLLLLYKVYPTHVHYIIFNPITREQVTFQLNISLICALFFHKFKKEYYALLWIYGEKNNGAQFELLPHSSLSSNNLDSGKKISNSVPPNLVPQPFTAIIKRDVIYWMAVEYLPLRNCYTYASCETTIIIFDIKEEEFHLISHPGGHTRCHIGETQRYHSHMHLFDKEGSVSFCDLSFSKNQLTMHVWDLLQEYNWSQRETIILQMKPFPFRHSGLQNQNVKPIGTLNGELIISWQQRGVFAYNLQLKTLRKLGNMGDHVFIHTKTILSLKTLLQKAPNCDALNPAIATGKLCT